MDISENRFTQFVDREMRVRDMSARGFAEFCKISPETINRILRGYYDYTADVYPSVDTLLSIAKALSIPPESLLELVTPPELAELSSNAVRLSARIATLSADDIRLIENFIDGARLRAAQQASNQKK